MNNKFFLFLSFILLLVVTSSCKKALVLDTIASSSEQLTNCQNVSCPEITTEYVMAQGTSEGAKKINAQIEKFVIQSLYIGENEMGSTALTIDDAMNDFIALYRTHSAEFPDLGAEYFAEVTVVPLYNSKHLLSLSAGNYLYTGGAHGNGMTTFMNFDPQTGAMLDYEAIFSNVSVLDAKAEEMFRSEHDIAANESINATGFWFENDTFTIPESFGISKEFVTLQYNPYEIASYAAGPIIIEIPISEVKDILNIAIE